MLRFRLLWNELSPCRGLERFGRSNQAFVPLGHAWERGPAKHYRKTPLLFTCASPALWERAGEEAQGDRFVSQASLAPGGRGAESSED